MAKGSQLSQLKSKLSSAGLNRQSQPGGNNRDSAKAKEAQKKRKRGPDDEKKLEKIRKEMNPFEEKTTRVSCVATCLRRANLEEKRREPVKPMAASSRTDILLLL